MTPEEREARRNRVVELRRQGYSRWQIARELGLKSGSRALDRALKGIPPPEWTKRPNAKDELRAQAISLRKQGLSYKQIRAILGGSSSSLSLWLKDVPLTDLQKAGLRRRRQDAVERTARRNRENRLAREEVTRRAAAAEVGPVVSDRELFVAGVVAYAAEGAKNKPWGASRPVTFMNSDPRMIRLFLQWLELIGIERDRVTFRLSIHERADVHGALHFWSNVVGVAPERFQRTTLKRHNPKTVRRNVGHEYHGCLGVRVRASVDLNRRIDGWFQALVARIEEHGSRNCLYSGASPD